MANIFFNHDCAEAHDNEIQAGADNALCLKLGYVLLQYRTLEQSNQQQSNNMDMMDENRWSQSILYLFPK